MESQRDMTKPVVYCSHISKTFQGKRETKQVISDISIQVKENEFVALFGPGQCGKTTIMNILSGLEPPSAGQVYLEDKQILSPNSKMGVVFQSLAIFPWLTVMGNVEYGLKMRHVPKAKRRARAQHYIDLVGLSGFEKAYPTNDIKYKHFEGNSHAHMKSSTMGASQTLIIDDEKLILGTWQDIYFCEFDGPRNRSFYVKIIEG